MNTKLSGAQLVLVPITKVGDNLFPYVTNLHDRYIKYMDFCPAQYLPDTAMPGLQTSNDIFVTLYDRSGTTRLIDSLPLERFDYNATTGIRQTVASEITLEKCVLVNNDPSAVGKTAAFVFWYDLPQFSARNTTDRVLTDNVDIELTSSTQYNQFPDDERMINKRFRRILASTPALTPNFNAGVTAAQLPNLYLTLRKGSYLVLDNVPLSLLVQLKQLTKTEFANIIFDFQSSYITIGGAGTIPNVGTDYVGKHVFLNLQYERK